MAFYDFSKEERNQFVDQINQDIFEDLSQGAKGNISGEDTYYS